MSLERRIIARRRAATKGREVEGRAQRGPRRPTSYKKMAQKLCASVPLWFVIGKSG
jgi:hypothetical protein